ncbi:MAG: acyltransferase [Paludibacteraceae bacterium]|nr:acyltransferase [Paludibacteraceae bacterium]
MDKFKDIRAYHTGWLLQIIDWFTVLPLLHYFARTTTRGLRLDYLGDRNRIERDIRHGATFLTNHRDIVMDAAWLSYLLRIRYNIRPYIGMGNNLFGKWWIEGAARFNRVFVVRRGVSAHELIAKSRLLSEYIRHLRRHGKSIWLAQREGRAKDSDDRTQPSVLKMLCMTGEERSFFDQIRELNICPVSISYEYDPCDYLKAQEMQLKRDNPRWRKRAADDLLSMKTGILGRKGRVVFRLTPSINPALETLLQEHPELQDASLNEQAQAVAHLIDRQIFAGYEEYKRGTDFEEYITKRVKMVQVPEKDEAFLTEKIREMYSNPMRNKQELKNTDKYENSNIPG